MPTLRPKLKTAYFHFHPDDGLMLSVTAIDGQQFDMTLSPEMLAAFISQIAALMIVCARALTPEMVRKKWEGGR